MQHIMLDIETLGTGSQSAIIQIGAIAFNIELAVRFGQQFKVNIDLRDSLKNGFEVDGDTIYWWMQQGQAARDSVTVGKKSSVAGALGDFSRFVKSQNSGVQVWGNGATFDNVIVSEAYRRMNIKRPWSFRNDRDIRTIMSLPVKRESIAYFPQQKGLKHDALEDCRRQLNWFIPAYQSLLNKN